MAASRAVPAYAMLRNLLASLARCVRPHLRMRTTLQKCSLGPPGTVPEWTRYAVLPPELIAHIADLATADTRRAMGFPPRLLRASPHLAQAVQTIEAHLAYRQASLFMYPECATTFRLSPTKTKLFAYAYDWGERSVCFTAGVIREFQMRKCGESTKWTMYWPNGVGADTTVTYVDQHRHTLTTCSSLFRDITDANAQCMRSIDGIKCGVWGPGDLVAIT